MHADYVFINGEVITVGPDDHVFQAAAVRGNQICAVGTTEELLDLSGPETQVVDLQGNSLLPGFIDSHLHMLLYGTNQLGVDCKNDVGNIEGVQARLAERARTAPAGEWIRGWGYNDQRLAEGRHPTRDDLDEVSVDHPLIAVWPCNHTSVVNSKALELLGSPGTRPTPKGARSRVARTVNPRGS